MHALWHAPLNILNKFHPYSGPFLGPAEGTVGEILGSGGVRGYSPLHVILGTQEGSIAIEE